ncbi:unnamed protein product [Rotaria magnacalcarata]|uniref:FGGY carbohydrate kinase domain-containing protein n=2 Tax=Rotaria magnacalcarata TaxID=392030 RepID=A0A816NXI3_9BILA|nr:unnamed protein product [Rotaria magnacalcarata]
MASIRPKITVILAYIIMGLTLSAIALVVLSIGTNHWIHTIQMRAGLWKLCHLQPIACFHSILCTPAALSLIGLFLIVIGLIVTIIFYIVEWNVSSSVRPISLISVFSLGFGTFFLVISFVTFSHIAAQFCYSYYLLIVAHLFSMTAAIVASYLEGRRNALVSASITIISLRMSGTHPLPIKELHSNSPAFDMPSKSFNKQNSALSTTILLRSDSSSSLNDSGQQLVNKRVVNSCLWSTVIFSINFVSSILVINLAKWIYVKHHFPNLTLTTINFFVTFLLLLGCMQAKLFTYVKLPIFNMIPVSICFGGFIAFSNLSLQYNTVGTYQLIKLQVTPTVMIISWLFFKAHYSLPIVISFIPVFIGTLISTYYDLQLNVFGLFCALISVMFTAFYQILMSASSSYAIGIDVGTGSVRCMIFDEKWTPVVQCQKPILTYHSASAPLEYEQSSTDIWQAICYCVRQCLELGSFTSEQVGLIRSIGFDATCSLVVLDEKYEPVSVSRSGNDEQNIIMWLDHRAHAEATIINSSADEVLQNFGGKISLEMQPGKLMWLKRNLSKEQWTRANHFFDLPDYLHFRATNQLDRSLCSSVCKLCYRSSETQHGWDENFWAKFDLDDLMKNNGEKLGQLVRKPFSKSNTDVLSKKAADELGLPEGIHIGTPLIDAYAGALGGLACKSPIVDAHLSERLIIVAGTSSCFMACSEKAVFVPGVWGPHYNVLIPNLWLSEGGQSAAGKSIDHVIQIHPAYNELKQLADEQNRNTFDVLNEILNNLQQKHKIDNVSLLSNDLHMTIDFHGNRSPLADPGLGATIAGLNFDTSLNNLAIQYLTVVQAVAYDSRHIIETMTKSGHHFRVVQICGGLARLGLLTQIIADVVQMPVYVSEPTNDCVLLGAAICGQLIADNERQVEDLLNNIACPIQVYMPDSKIADFHKDKYEIYRLLQQTEMDNRKRMSKYSQI